MSHNNTLTNKEIFAFLDSIERKMNEYREVYAYMDELSQRDELINNDIKNHLSEQMEKISGKQKNWHRIYGLLLSQTI